MSDLISREAAKGKIGFVNLYFRAHGQERYLDELIDEIPVVDAVEVNAAELKYLINDTVAYIWRMEDSGRDKPEFGYDNRKALLEKLKQFEREHFPEIECSYGERREENADSIH